MIADLGSYFLFISILLSAISIFYALLRRAKLLPLVAISSQIFVIISYLILLYLFLTQDFRVISVLMNSSSLMELKYRIAATWSSHETSLLFWVFIMALVNLCRIFSQSVIISIFIQAAFSSIILLTANPFKHINSVPSDGLGMNPSLQDIAMMIHPPFLYISYSIFQIIYADNLFSALCDSSNKIGKDLLLRYSRYGIAILTLAIGLGGWWAYRELGWGGYWFFDPVENISLLVWLFAISYHHSLYQKYAGFSQRILGIAPFLSALFGTFFVRSGLLVSVHSFAQTETSFWLFCFSIILFFGSIIVLTIKTIPFVTANSSDNSGFIGALFKSPAEVEFQKSSINKDFMISFGNILWFCGALIIIISLISPLIIYQINGETIEIEFNFFKETLVPVMLCSSILAGIIYYIKDYKRNLLIILPGLVLLGLRFFSVNYLYIFGYYVSYVILLASLVRFHEKYLQNKINKLSVSMILGHGSAGLLILAICLNNQFGYSKTITLDINEKAEFTTNKFITINQVKYGAGKNFIKQLVDLRISEGNKEIVALRPELRFYPVEKKLSSEVDIYSFITSDWYSVINNIEDEKVNLTIIYHPFISMIWFSILFISFSFLVRNFG